MKPSALLILAVWLANALPLNAETIKPVKAAVFRSTGTQFLGQTIWPELNAGWSDFGDVPVEIDWWSLAGSNVTDAELEASRADVLIISTAGYTNYSDAEIAAITDYVESGHGIIITYFSFLGNKRYLAPLVGLSDTIYLGSSTVTEPIQFELLAPEHSLFAGLTEPYVSGVPYSAYVPDGSAWPIHGGIVLANMFTGVIAPEPGIIAKETDRYRGLYFSHYLEALSGGTNQQDMQVFYNGLVWTAAPEPTTASLCLCAALLVTVRCRRRRQSIGRQ